MRDILRMSRSEKQRKFLDGELSKNESQLMEMEKKMLEVERKFDRFFYNHQQIMKKQLWSHADWFSAK